MRVNIIYDTRRSEKYEPLIQELRWQGISNYVIHPCIMVNDVVESINLSHKMLVKDAKENNEEMACIMEDDCYFPAYDGWKHFLSKMPKEFDIYSSATYCNDIENKNHLCGFHLYVIHSNFYDKFLSIPDNVHIDTAIDNLGGDFHVCRPFAALQRPSWSANNKMEVNYNAILQDEDVYGKFR